MATKKNGIAKVEVGSPEPGQATTRKVAATKAGKAAPKAPSSKPFIEVPSDAVNKLPTHRAVEWQHALPEDRLAHLVRDAGRSFQRALQLRLAEESVPVGHWLFLRVLWVRDGLTQKALSVQAGVMEPTTVAAMKTMESLGYIERRKALHNQKNIHVYLTRKGRALEKRLVPLAADINELGTVGISKSAISITRETLIQIIHNLSIDEGVAGRQSTRSRPMAPE